MAERHHQYTGTLLLLFALLVLMSAIFFTVAQSKVTGIAEYKTGNEKLKNAKNNLMIAYILGYIAAGMGIVLAILYYGHVAWGISSEIPHLILFILLFLLVIVSGIFGFIALSNISDANPSNKNGSESWIWAALVSALVGVIVIIISGAWRAQYKADKSSATPVIAPVEPKSELTFTAPTTVYTSQPNYQAPTWAGTSQTAPQTAPPQPSVASAQSQAPSYVYV